MTTTRILSIDGGGVRGVIPIVLLQRLCREPGLEGCLERVDLAAGTSTGGIIALGVAAGLELATLRELYEQRAARVFKDSLSSTTSATSARSWAPTTTSPICDASSTTSSAT